MKTVTTQQEVLLFTGTGFTARQYYEKDNSVEGGKNLSDNERLQEACWNGLLKDMLPEVFIMSGPAAKLFLWQMRDAVHFFALEMGEAPKDIDHSLSIDPYWFMATQSNN